MAQALWKRKKKPEFCILQTKLEERGEKKQNAPAVHKSRHAGWRENKQNIHHSSESQRNALSNDTLAQTGVENANLMSTTWEDSLF